MSREVEPLYEVLLQSKVMVPMRDGVRLATDVYLPATEGRIASGRFPTIIERTPYNRTQDSRSEIDANASRRHTRMEVARTFVERGYIVIYQDCRGRHDSEGGFVKYLSEAKDGADTIAWIRAQPWSNGKVATKGLSYCAHTQMALASLAPQGLGAMVLDSGGFSNAFHGGIRQGGAFELKQVTWAFNQAKNCAAREGNERAVSVLDQEDIVEWFKFMPWRPGHTPLSTVPEYEDYLFEQWTHDTFSDYWRQPGIYAAGSYDVTSSIPQVHVSSWYDVYVRTALENYEATRRRGRAAVQLIMGPWLHGDRNVTYSGDVEFGPVAAFDGNIDKNWRSFRLAWFDRWIKDIPNGVDKQPPVRLFLMGGGSGRKDGNGRLLHGGRWVASSAWPIPGTHFVDYFLHADGSLTPEKPEGTNDALTYDFDPASPVPTIGGSLTSGRPVFEGGAFDQRETRRFFGTHGNGLPIAARSDVLVFQTPPLVEDTAIVGPIVVRLHVSSNCPDTDFTAKLIDVHPANDDYPQGFAMNLTDGILRCRFRNSWEHPEPMVAGMVYEITIEPFATANLFKAGHRIRLDISSSNFPKYDVNSNSGQHEATARSRRVATNTVHLSATHASRVILPVVPTSLLAPLA